MNGGQERMEPGLQQIKAVFHNENLNANERRKRILELLQQHDVSNEALTPAIRELIQKETISSVPRFLQFLWSKKRVAYGLLLLGSITIYFRQRFSVLVGGAAKPVDYILFIIGVVLLLTPIFPELALFGMKFRRQIDSVRSEVRELKNHFQASIMSFQANVRSTVNIEQHSSDTTKIVEQVKEAFVNPTKEIETSKNQEMKTKLEEHNKQWLKVLGEWIKMYTYEQAYNRIYGSQINFLLRLRDTPPQRSMYWVEESIYGHLGAVFPALKAYPFNQWLAFLRGYKFIRIEAGWILIEPAGLDFLKYIVNNNYIATLPRPN